jgi:ribosomal protein S18 acetylase RimI-like enzyme
MAQDATVETIGISDAERTIATLTSAFIADPLFRWIYPTPDNYLDAFPRLVQAYCGSGIDDGTAFQARDFAGASIWLGPGRHPDEEATVAIAQETIPADRIEDVFGLLGELGNYHPQDESIWYLPFIGVDAVQQGGGLGSALMTHALRLCDEQGLRAYLESSNPRNIPLYERHGFQVMARLDVGSAPPVHPMIRERP